MNSAQWTRWQEFLTWQDGIEQTEFDDYTQNAWVTLYALWLDYVVHGLDGGREHPPHRPS